MTTGIRVVDQLTGQVLWVERNGEKLRITAPKGAATKEVLERLAGIKDLLLTTIDEAERLGWCERTIPEETQWMTPAQYKARMVNRIFDTLGTSKWPSRITAQTVEHGQRAQRRSRGQHANPEDDSIK